MISKKMQAMVNSSSAIRAMFEEGKRLASLWGEDKVFDFSLGNPNIAPPAAVADAVRAELQADDPVFLHGYMSNAGYDDVRAKIASSLNARFGTNYEGGGVVMTVGAAGGLNVVLKSLLDDGDEVIVVSPYFGEYRCYAANFGGKLVEVPALADFMPDCAAIEAAVGERTKAVIVNTPNNPTGAVYGADVLKELALALERASKRAGRPVYLISDEPYRELVYGGAVQPYVGAYYRNTLTCYSYSKSLSLGVATRILGFVNAPSLMQRVIARCVDVKPDVAFYDRNRELFESVLDEAGLEYVKPQGAFYLFVKAPDGDEAKFCARAKERGILIVPSTSFGVKGYARAAYCVSPAKIEGSREAFKALAASYN